MGNFVADDGFHFLFCHAAQQTGGDGNQRIIFESASAKGVGFTFIDANFGHFDAGLVGKTPHGFHDPCLVSVFRLVDDVHIHAGFGHGFAHQQRNDGACKSDD